MSASYYDRPVLKEPVWKPEAAVYLWAGGIAGVSALLALVARRTGRATLARRAHLASFAALVACPPLLIVDLGRPDRFYNMLRVFKPTSPMSLGTWVLTAFGMAETGAALSEASGRFRGLGRLAELAAGILGLPLATYTAVLLSDTSIPVWHKARHHLPFVFAGSAASAAGGAAAVLTPVTESGPARRLALFGALLELGAVVVMERSLGAGALPYREGPAASTSHAARYLTAAGVGILTVAGRRRWGAATGGSLLLAGSLSLRLSILRAGPPSARATVAGPTVQ